MRLVNQTQGCYCLVLIKMTILQQLYVLKTPRKCVDCLHASSRQKRNLVQAAQFQSIGEKVNNPCMGEVVRIPSKRLKAKELEVMVNGVSQGIGPRQLVAILKNATADSGVVPIRPQNNVRS